MSRQLEQLLHAGEITAQQRFDSRPRWQTPQGQQALDQMLKEHIDANAARFIQQQPCFFIATANANGACDCSFRGTEPNLEGKKQPAVVVRDEKTLVFPDYSGNQLYNSIGNLIENQQIGMLFIDFIHATRLRVNGRTRLIEDRTAYQAYWHTALRYVEVSVEQVYANCQKRIRESVSL